jgi:hypothetical protein
VTAAGQARPDWDGGAPTMMTTVVGEGGKCGTASELGFTGAPWCREG